MVHKEGITIQSDEQYAEVDSILRKQKDLSYSYNLDLYTYKHACNYIFSLLHFEHLFMPLD